MADLIAPEETGPPDYVGAFAVTAGLRRAAKVAEFKADLDDYSAILLESLADRFAERMHQRMLTECYGPGEVLTVQEVIKEQYDGIRPAPGYPAWPRAHREAGHLGAARFGFDEVQCSVQRGGRRCGRGVAALRRGATGPCE